MGLGLSLMSTLLPWGAFMSGGVASTPPTWTFAVLWEPSLGLGLSLMSTLLPWGAFMSGGVASTPPTWTFAVGIAAAGLLCVAACRTGAAKAPFGVAVHVAMPVLAAAVVGLRMLGDTGSASAVLDMVRGIASGVTAAFFFVFAWLAMAYSSRAHEGSAVPFAVGLSLAFSVGAVVLPLHALSQSAASLMAPVLSLVFLVVASCSSFEHLGGLSLAFSVGAVVLPLHALSQSAASLMAPVLSLVFLVVASCSSFEHLGHRGMADAPDPVEPGPLSIEEAAARLAADRGLSPRETEVLVRLASGRSAEGIAEVLGISPNTVRAHVRNIHEKLQVSSRDQVIDAIEAARRQG